MWRAGVGEACQGDGVVKVRCTFCLMSMCPATSTQGQRYSRETPGRKWKGPQHRADFLDATVETRTTSSKAVPTLARKLQTLLDVGLSTSSWGASRHTFRRRGAASSWH